jgi:hypothetical protein
MRSTPDRKHTAPRGAAAVPWTFITLLVTSLVIALIVRPEHHTPLDWAARGMFVAAIIGQLGMMVAGLIRPTPAESDV